MSSDGQDLTHHQSSGSIGQMVPQRLSPSLINLEHLSPEERSIIQTVLDRDEQLRSYEQDRVKKLKGELHNLRKKSAAKESDENESCRVCVRCREPLGLLFKTGDNCPKCQHRVCKNCQVTLPSGTRWLCTVCHKAMQLQLETGEWYYKKLQVDEVPLLGSDLVKASLAKAKQSLTDPTTAPVLTASDLRSKTSSHQGKGSRGRKQQRRMNSQSSSDYASSTTRESSRPSVRYENSSSNPNSPVISHMTSSSGVGNYAELNSDPEDHPRGVSGIRWRRAAVVNQAGNRLTKHKGDKKTNSLKPESHFPSNSSGSERLSATDSSEVDAVVEPITGFTFHRVSFRKERGKSDNTSKDSADQAYQLHEGLSSERSISDSGLEDSLCSGQTGGSSTNPSPTDLLPLTSDPSVFHPYGLQGTCIDTGRSSLRSDLDFPRLTGYVSRGTDMTADTIIQANSTPPVGFMIVSEPSASETATNYDQSSYVNADEIDFLDNNNLRDLGGYVFDENQVFENKQSSCVLIDNHLDVDQSEARQTPLKVDNSRKLLKISPNTAFSLLGNNIQSSESPFHTISESNDIRFFKPIQEPNFNDVAHSLNSVYLNSERSLLKPKEGHNSDSSYFEDIESDLYPKQDANTEVVSPNSEERVELALSSENCRSNRNMSENDTNQLARRQGSLDDSSTDSVCTPSDESDSLCELELDWDLRSSSPDFQEVQLQTKLKKNQLLMNKLMKEAQRATPDFFHRTSSVSSEDDVFQIHKNKKHSTQPPLSKESKSTESDLNLMEKSQNKGHAGHLRKREGESCIKSQGDSDLSSSVSSWVDSDPSSDDHTSVIPTSTLESSNNEATGLSSQRTNQKVVIPRPNWAEIKVQQWKATGANRSFRSKRPSGRSEAGSQPKVISEGPVLITEKNKGMYIVNPGCDNPDSDSDSSSDDSDQISRTNASHSKKLPSRSKPFQLSYCSSSDSELSTIMEVSEEDLSALSLENSPSKTEVFHITLTHGVPSIVVSDQPPCMSNTEEDADDEADESPHFLTPYYEPRVGWPNGEP